jgi:hypothetical protein
VELAGKRVKCKCGNPLIVPALGAAATGNVNDRQTQDVLVFCASPFLLNIASDVVSLRAAPDGAR